MQQLIGPPQLVYDCRCGNEEAAAVAGLVFGFLLCSLIWIAVILWRKMR